MSPQTPGGYPPPFPTQQMSPALYRVLTQHLSQSYGTVLGQYFTTMYPDKVGRMIIDGVYDGYNYRASLWNSNLLDNKAIIDSIFTFCHQAGPEGCALYESTPAAIRDRFFGVLESVKQAPVPNPHAKPPSVVTYKDLVSMITVNIYAPILGHPYIVATINAIETGNQTALAELVAGTAACDCASPATPPKNNNIDLLHAVGCGDADPQTYDCAAYQAFFADLTRVAPTVGPFWVVLHLECTQWQVRLKWHYTGMLEAHSMAHPMLILQTRFDPVTPLRDVLAVRARYEGAGLLVQDSYGHMSLSTPSACTAKYVRAYLEEGTMPKEGTVCEPDELPLWAG